MSTCAADESGVCSTIFRNSSAAQENSFALRQLCASICRSSVLVGSASKATLRYFTATENCFEWGNRGAKMALLELGKSQIELDAGQLGIEGQGSLVGLGCLRVLLFLRKNYAETGVCGSIAGIAFSNSAPHS